VICAALLTLVAPPAPPPSAPVGEVLARAIAGDRAAFNALYLGHVEAVRRLLTRLVGPSADRDDLVQQTFLDAYRALPKFRGEAAFSTWLYRIAVRLAYRHLRRWRVATASAVDHALALEVVAPGPGPESRAHQREELRRALAMLDKLSAKKRIAYVLRVVEGLSLDEIGALVGANAPAVGQRVKHAQRELEAMIERARRAEGRP
jgi:RNA polymerase sigma-70 factor (ECF subfamily)